jgi:hypothetical protein
MVYSCRMGIEKSSLYLRFLECRCVSEMVMS